MFTPCLLDTLDCLPCPLLGRLLVYGEGVKARLDVLVRTAVDNIANGVSVQSVAVGNLLHFVSEFPRRPDLQYAVPMKSTHNVSFREQNTIHTICPHDAPLCTHGAHLRTTLTHPSRTCPAMKTDVCGNAERETVVYIYIKGTRISKLHLPSLPGGGTHALP